MSAPRDVPPAASVPCPLGGGVPPILPIKIELETFRFASVMGRAHILLGYPAEGWLVPGFWEAHIDPDDRDRVLAHCRAEAKAGRGHEINYRMVHRSGERVWVHQCCDYHHCQNFRGGVAHLSGFIMDITAYVAQQAEATRVTLLREALVHVVSKQLAEPVNEISGYAKLLERYLARQSDDFGGDYAVGMRGGIETLRRNVKRLQAVAQGERVDFEDVLTEQYIEGLEAPDGPRIAAAPLSPRVYGPDTPRSAAD